MKVQIVSLGKKDAWYAERKNLVGNIGEFSSLITNKGGFCGGYFLSDNPIYVFGKDKDFAQREFTFVYVKVHQIK